MAKKPDLARHILAVAMQLAAERGWRGISMADLAEAAKIPLVELWDYARHKNDVLRLLNDEVNRQVLAGGPAVEGLARDRVFEVVMRRFDAMAPYRPGLRAVARGMGDDPLALLIGGKRLFEAAALTLETAGLTSTGFTGLVRIKGFAALYLYMLRTFLNDDSEDLSKTMAAVDKALRQAEGWTRGMWRRSPGEEGPEGPAEMAG